MPALFSALFLLLSHQARAQFTEQILSLAVTNASGYVIDSDGNFPSAVYDRDRIHVSAQVRYSTGHAAPTNIEYSLQFRLVDEQTNAVPLVGGTGPGATVRSLTDQVVLPYSFLGFTFTTLNQSYGIDLQPAARLNPHERYRIELRLLERPAGSAGRFAFSGEDALSDPRTYYHFTNTTSGDAAFNVIACLDSNTVTRAYAVKTVAGEDAFRVAATYQLRRYDDFYSQPAAAQVTVNFRCELFDAQDGTAIPLVNSNKSVVRSINSFAFGAPYQPVVLGVTDTLDFKPAPGVQLDSVNRTYIARVSIWHIDQAGQPATPGNSTEAPPKQLLHFNGRLYFGAIETIFTSIDNTPGIGIVVPNSHVTSQLGVDNNSGYVAGHPSHTYGDGTDLPVRLLASGNAVFTGGSVNVNEPSPDTDSAAGVRYERQNVVLDTAGAHATVIMTLPAGFGYRADLAGRRLLSKITWNNVSLNQALDPAVDLVHGTPLFAVEETKPFWVGASSLRWVIASGRLQLTPTSVHYVRSNELTRLEAAPGLVEADMKLKRSNEQYFRSLQGIASSLVVVEAGPGGQARMTVDVDLGAGEFTTHFPYDSTVRWSGAGRVQIAADQVVSTNSGLTGVQAVTSRYDQDCPGCGPGKGRTALTLVPDGDRLVFTIDGGLQGAGALASPKPLNWGWISAPAIQKFAQRTTPFAAGNFLAAGCFLRGDQTALPSEDRPGVLLLTGVSPANPSQLERFGTPAYLDGYADYAGMNFRVVSNGWVQAESVLAGKASGLYDLTGRSKYYTRWSGVSGIHEAVPGTFPATMELYGYEFSFSNYGLSYLSNENEESRTEGHVHVRSPSNFDQNFKELRFSCVGALESARIPANEAGQYKLLEYWNGDFITLTIHFDRSDAVACDPSVGYLVLGVQGHATHVPDPLFGSLGFKANGNLISAKDISSGEIKLDPGLNSRLKIPNNFKLSGPNSNEVYVLNPVSDVYYNDWEGRDPAAGQGFVNLAADLDVPFFENIKTHIHTTGKTNSPLAPVYLMGGWPNEGYGTAADNFFTNPEFDGDNTGYPAADGVDYYRNSPVSKYHPRAQTSWLGVIDLDYPLDWSSTLRWFKSYRPVQSDILILSTEHKVKYLSPANVELLFGAKADSAPYANVVSCAFNAADQIAGTLQAFQDAGLAPEQHTLKAGLDSLDTMLRADVSDFYGMAFLNNIQAGLWDFYNQLAVWRSFGQGSYEAMLPTEIDNWFNPNTGVLISRFRQLDVAQFGVIDTLKFQLQDAMAGIEAARAIIAKPDGTNRNTAALLMGELLKHLDPKLAATVTDLAGDTVNEKFTTYLNQYAGSLDRVDELLLAAKAQLQAQLDSLEPGGDFYNEIHQHFVQNDANLQAVVNQARQGVTQYLQGLNPIDNPFTYMNQSEVFGTFVHQVRDPFFASPLAPAVQVTAKHRIYDVDAAIREAVDTEFGLINTAIRTLVAEVLAKADKLVHKLLGKVGHVGGAAQVNGYAHINGDSLKLLRLDIAAQLQMPDTLEFQGYFQIKELDSDGTPSECLPIGGRATEVTLGAIDIPLSFWSSDTNDLKASVSAKFTFDIGPTNSPYPVPIPANFGGSFELKGSLKFQTLEVKYLSAGMAFGEVENYFTAAARVSMNSYEGFGGVFIGRTCTMDVFSWDRDIKAVLGTQVPFTGVYLYGEVWIPVSEVLLGIPATCFFDISAGVGAGAGLFIEGPTFVGKMLMGVSGRVLCVASVKATVALAGKANPNGLSLSGRGTLEGSVGPCPVCIDFSKDLFMTYEDFSWDIDF